MGTKEAVLPKNNVNLPYSCTSTTSTRFTGPHTIYILNYFLYLHAFLWQLMNQHTAPLMCSSWHVNYFAICCLTHWVSSGFSIFIANISALHRSSDLHKNLYLHLFLPMWGNLIFFHLLACWLNLCSSICRLFASSSQLVLTSKQKPNKMLRTHSRPDSIRGGNRWDMVESPAYNGKPGVREKEGMLIAVWKGLSSDGER